MGVGQSNVCASNRVTYRFMLIYVLAIIIMCFLILFGPFFWVQRYSNSPGNIVWILMFFLFGWNPAYRTLMVVIGILALVVSGVTLGINIVAAFTGITSNIKKAITFCWGGCMIIMLIN